MGGGGWSDGRFALYTAALISLPSLVLWDFAPRITQTVKTAFHAAGQAHPAPDPMLLLLKAALVHSK